MRGTLCDICMIRTRLTRNRKPKPCSYCKRQFGIVQITRSDAECELHHRVGLCKVHGGIDCDGTRDGCPGSYAERTR